MTTFSEAVDPIEAETVYSIRVQEEKFFPWVDSLGDAGSSVRTWLRDLRTDLNPLEADGFSLGYLDGWQVYPRSRPDGELLGVMLTLAVNRIDSIVTVLEHTDQVEPLETRRGLLDRIIDLRGESE